MARRGKFGRQPPVAPDLTSTIVSLSRQMMSQEDTNIMDAWQNGGLYEGKPVTDDMVLAHWKSRSEAVDKSDPLYDTYNDQYLQLQFKIGEDKAATLYAQGKLDDNGMAKFYLDWAKKTPVDSFFYRHIQQQAAKFLDAAKSKATAASNKAKTDAYNAKQADLEKGNATGNLLTWALTGLATTHNLLGADDTKGLLDLSDPAALLQLIDGINANPNAPIFNVGGQAYTARIFSMSWRRVTRTSTLALSMGQTRWGLAPSPWTMSEESGQRSTPIS